MIPRGPGGPGPRQATPTRRRRAPAIRGAGARRALAGRCDGFLAVRNPSPFRQSLLMAASTFSRDARRAGHSAASTPMVAASTVKIPSVVHGMTIP